MASSTDPDQTALIWVIKSLQNNISTARYIPVKSRTKVVSHILKLFVKPGIFRCRQITVFCVAEHIQEDVIVLQWLCGFFQEHPH